MEALENSMSDMLINPQGLCCNHQPGPSCTKVGSLACKNCHMVAGKYCSKGCQTAHWPIHRKDCQSHLMKGSWKPHWVMEQRSPAFMDSSNAGYPGFGALKYLWGNVPAVDVVQLGQNEGTNYQKPISLLFAASGDLRNVVLSVASLPQAFKSPLSIVINDREIDIVARNLIMLLLMLVEEDRVVAAESMLHIWYSALVTEACYTLLQEKIKPIIEDVCNKTVGKPGQSIFGKTWTFGGSSVRVVLTRVAWVQLLSYFEVPTRMTKKTAHDVRQAVVNAPSRVDFVDRSILMQPPNRGLGTIKYRQDGILIPFGQSHDAFIIPNPTIFDSSKQWPMMDSADPQDGWSMKTFLATKAGPAKRDTYGQLHHYLKRLFTEFHQSLRSKPISFELYHVDALFLGATLIGKNFDRIEVSNISDIHYLGTKKTLEIFGPLLRSPSANRHATLITYFLNAVPMAKMVSEQTDPLAASRMSKIESKAVLQYLQSDILQTKGSIAQMAQRFGMWAIVMASAVNLVSDMDKYFDMYVEMEGFAASARSAGVEMKERHTIIQRWPLKVKGGQHPTSKDKEDFKLLLGSGHGGQERYVEWKVEATKKAGGK
ncbi:hypothetical protein F5Y08DRAFT_349648 [Xylaria arbuscula]|nr:hypothetical protein F5Y08DRAFT_349648 [Xylaria arbuscula]